MASQARAVSAHIAAAAPAARTALRRIRRAILAAAPGAEERISYRLAAVVYRKRFIAYYGAFKAHVGFFPPPPAALRRACARYAGPKGNLRFPLDQPMPVALVRRIIRLRVRERDAKA